MQLVMMRETRQKAKMKAEIIKFVLHTPRCVDLGPYLNFV